MDAAPSIREEIVRVSREAFRAGLFAGTSGNLSVYQRQEGRLYITPSCLRYEGMEPGDIVVIDLEGHVLCGSRRPSSEWRMHAEVYRAMPHVNAVFHTHSPHAAAFAVSRRAIPATLIEMFYFLGGSVECAPYAPPGTAELGRSALPFLKGKGGCLLANHGVLAIGEDIEQARIRAEYIEEAARVYLLAKALGEPVILEDL